MKNSTKSNSFKFETNPAIALRQLMAAASGYLHGEGQTIATLNGYTVQAKEAANEPKVIALLDDWERMINRRWNEWGFEDQPISEAEFRNWLADQLGQFA